MPYLYATQRADYTDLSSGKVLYSLPGHPAFPIRLASEMFQRCLAVRAASGLTGLCVVYDPCCGAGYLLSVVAFLHPEQIGAVIGSDIDPQAAALAGRNLRLLSLPWLDQRIMELGVLFQQYSKESHRAALESAQRLRQKVQALPHPILARVFQADATQRTGLPAGLNGQKIDMVLTDVPYGQHSQWILSGSGSVDANPIQTMLEALTGVLVPGGIVAIATPKKLKISHPAYQRVDHFQIGKRQVVVLKATSTC